MVHPSNAITDCTLVETEHGTLYIENGIEVEVIP